MDHIDDMDQLRQGIGLQAYGQRDPLVEYKMIGYDMFGEMTRAIEVDTVRLLFHVNVEQKVEREKIAKVTGTNKDDSVAKGPKVRAEKKIYPNDPSILHRSHAEGTHAPPHADALLPGTVLLFLRMLLQHVLSGDA